MTHARPDMPIPASDPVPDATKRDALHRVLRSPEFETSPRLCEFLDYIVQEFLEGRSRGIKGKTIAADVYGRDIEKGSAGANIVRVEARRLRRLLDEYYAGTGAQDLVQIHIDPGGYVPRFELISQPEPPLEAEQDAAFLSKNEDEADEKQSRRALLWVVGLCACFGLAMGVIGLRPGVSVTEPETATQSAARSALREHSVNTLQASDIAAEARGLYFPVFDARRQKIALDMFTYAIELAPDLPDGHAGTAQVLATLHMIAPEPEARSAFLREARTAADAALNMAPSMAWAVAAEAWVLAQEGRVDEALRKARLALELAPQDGHVLDLVGVTAVFAGDPELAMRVSDPGRNRQVGRSSGTQNIWGLANLMYGNDVETIAAFSSAPAEGAVVSPPSLIFQAVAHDRLGDTAEAKRLAVELEATWPNFPQEFLIKRIFLNNSHLADEILRRMSALK